MIFKYCVLRRPTVCSVPRPLFHYLETSNHVTYGALPLLLYDVVCVLSVGREEVADVNYVTGSAAWREMPFKPAHYEYARMCLRSTRHQMLSYSCILFTHNAAKSPLNMMANGQKNTFG